MVHSAGRPDRELVRRSERTKAPPSDYPTGQGRHPSWCRVCRVRVGWTLDCCLLTTRTVLTCARRAHPARRAAASRLLLYGGTLKSDHARRESRESFSGLRCKAGIKLFSFGFV